MMGRPAVVTHRGGAGLWPENSLTAFRSALARGYALIELDVHPTSDGELVVIHDPTLDRTTDRRGAVEDFTWRQLSEAVVMGTAGETLPRLSDVLDLVRSHGAALIVEVKSRADGSPYPGLCRELVRQLADSGIAERCAVSAFDWSTLHELHALAPTLRLIGVADATGIARRGGAAAAIDRLRALGASALGLDAALIDGSLVALIHGAGLQAGAWTVNDAEGIRRLARDGVDWIISDRPDLALRALAEEPCR